MIKAVENIKEYFQTPEHYFWRWSDNGAVIEWVNGNTICYRDDLVLVLKEFQGKKLPPLDPLILILAACQEKININHKLALSDLINQFQDNSLNALADKALTCLQSISALPNELKKGKSRSMLIQEIFPESEIDHFHIQQNEAFDELSSGRLDSFLAEKKQAITKEEYISVLILFEKAIDKFQTTDRLAIKLRTGLFEAPAPVPVQLTEHAKTALLESLAQDTHTNDIALLARKLISVINIPMHSRRSGEHSYGGITDITNRGNYDRLLISELAQDDLLLMARLVNNEALYFRREEPPDQPKRKRTLLLDTSLKMWGIPRVFALAAALAFAHLSKHDEVIASYSLDGEKYHATDLSQKEGIISAMEHLDHALHSGKALVSVISDLQETDLNEYVLFTDAGSLNHAAFHSFLQRVINELRFIVTVSRTGELQFFECNQGRTHLLNSAKIDLEDLFSKPLNLVRQLKEPNEILPRFLTCKESPLLFPKVRMKQIAGKMSMLKSGNVLAVSENQRVLLLTTQKKGAYEILNYIEKGRYTFGSNEEKAFLLVYNSQQILTKLVVIDQNDLTVNICTIPEITDVVKEAAFMDDNLYIITNYSSFVFDCIRLEVVMKGSPDQYQRAFLEAKQATALLHSQPSLNAVVLSSIGTYSIMYKMKNIFISEEGTLILGHCFLSLEKNNNDIRVRENLGKPNAVRSSRIAQYEQKLLQNKKIKFCRRVWTDGSEVITDSRGFLHLKSSDTSLPEITIVAISGTNTACWASDGISCGVTYFINESQSKMISCEHFYRVYIQAYINRIMKHEIAATV